MTSEIGVNDLGYFRGLLGQTPRQMTAESVLGPRDVSKKIGTPTFVSDGPYIRNTQNWDGAHAELSPNAAGYWPTAVYEMGHETVHLLNPGPPNASVLEEGIAVAFALFAMEDYGLPPHEESNENYAKALRLVRRLPPEVFAAGKLIRDAVGEFRNADTDALRRLFPKVDFNLLHQLSQPFPLR